MARKISHLHPKTRTCPRWARLGCTDGHGPRVPGTSTPRGAALLLYLLGRSTPAQSGRSEATAPSSEPEPARVGAHEPGDCRLATTLLRPDKTFYPSPRLASEAPVETLAYMVTFDPTGKSPDRLVTVDVDPKSPEFGKEVGHVELPNRGDELHHFGWNACSSALCPYAPHPHIERRYLLVPGLRSSRIYIFDTKADRLKPKLVHTISAEENASRAGYSRPHTIHCGPDAIYVSALGAPNGDGPGGLFLLDHESFDVLGRWEVDRGPQQLAYDVWW